MRLPNHWSPHSASELTTLDGLRVREVRYVGGTRQDRHRHSEAFLSLLLAGEVEEVSQAMTYRAVAGSMVVKPAGYWHANTYGPRGTLIVQVVPSQPDELFPTHGWKYRWYDAPRLARSILGLIVGRVGAAEAAEFALWDAVDQLSDLTDGASVDRRPPWWDDAVDLLDECTAQPISVGAVARRVGVHPVHLARVCRRRLGCTVREYIRERRVLAAWRACQRAEAPLSTIALGVGFADQSHMTRAFSEVLGTSPGRLQRLAARIGNGSSA